jgi:hypothetical protein
MIKIINKIIELNNISCKESIFIDYLFTEFCNISTIIKSGLAGFNDWQFISLQKIIYSC